VSVEYKPGVKITGMQVETLAAIVTADGVYSRMGVPKLVVTSVTDGSHGPHSRHRVGLAADLRTFNIDESISHRDVVRELKSALGDDFDVVLESDHIHIEFDPAS